MWEKMELIVSLRQSKVETKLRQKLRWSFRSERVRYLSFKLAAIGSTESWMQSCCILQLQTFLGYVHVLKILLQKCSYIMAGCRFRGSLLLNQTVTFRGYQLTVAKKKLLLISEGGKPPTNTQKLWPAPLWYWHNRLLTSSTG